MGMQGFQGMLQVFQQQFDDDMVDRMHYFVTSSCLVLLGALISFKQFGGTPMECWVPAVFTRSWEQYTEMYCWSQNTYFLPFTDEIPNEIAKHEQLQISYYQWTPFFMMIEALMFYFPCLMWRAMYSNTGIRIHDIVTMVREKVNIDPELRGRTMTSVARHVEAAIRHQQALANSKHNWIHRCMARVNSRYYEFYVTGLYLTIKMLYFINVMLNLFLMNKFLQADQFGIYGFGVLRDILDRQGWKDSGNFPRVTLCDFEVRTLGNVQRHTVQCVLMINIFTEKIFIGCWIWFTFLSAATLLDIFHWINVSLRSESRFNFVMRHLKAAEDLELELSGPKDAKKIEKFINEYIKIDGVFILRMIGSHAGLMVCSELVYALWRRFNLLCDEDSDEIIMDTFVKSSEIKPLINAVHRVKEARKKALKATIPRLEIITDKEKSSASDHSSSTSSSGQNSTAPKHLLQAEV